MGITRFFLFYYKTPKSLRSVTTWAFIVYGGIDMDLRSFYDENKDFKDYVDAYCKKTGIPVEVALEHFIIRSVAHHYMERGNL